jgi:hypothetical protein
MTAQRGSRSTEIGGRKAQEAPSVGQESSAPAPNGDHNGKPPEALSGGPENSAPARAGARSRLTRILQSIKRAPIWAWAVAAVVVVVVGLPILALVGVLGGESAEGDGGNAGKTANPPAVQKPVEGSFVGKVSRMKVLVAVVVAPAEAGQKERAVEVYVTDGDRVSESFSGSISNNSFVAESDDGDSEVKGNLRGESVRGTVELPDDKTVRYRATRPAGAAGLYDLTLSAGGRLRGASAGGIGVTGRIELLEGTEVLEGTGVLRLADGRRLRFDLAEAPASDLVGIRSGQVRLIVLPNGRVVGAGKRRSASEGDSSSFFIRSSPA